MSQNVCSLGSTKLKRQMKVEGRLSLYVKPLYGKPPEIIFDKKLQVTRN
jgi:hypothetical protein